MTARRPVLRWHGGKWILAPWIISHLPAHRTYVEPFGGAASVLLRKPKAYAEVYNDLDDDVVNLMRVLQRPQDAARLIELLHLTPFARTEFEDAYRPTRIRVEKARRLIIRSFMGFGSDGHNTAVKTGFRSTSSRSGTTPAHDWSNFPESLRFVVERLRGVVIERRPAVEVMLQHDGPGTLHYLDPPYMAETRSAKSRKGGARYHVYKHEMTVEDHAALLDAARALEGMVVISGYRTGLYDEILSGWTRVERAAMADGAQARVEVLWLNPAACAASRQGDMFKVVA